MGSLGGRTARSVVLLVQVVTTRSQQSTCRPSAHVVIQIHKCRPTEINGFQSSSVFNINIQCVFVGFVKFTTTHRSSSVNSETSNATYWTSQFRQLDFRQHGEYRTAR